MQNGTGAFSVSPRKTTYSCDCVRWPKAKSLRLGGRSLVCRTPLELCHKIAGGAHLTFFPTGLGSVIGSAISPVIKVCANPETFRRMAADIDADAWRVLEGKAAL